MTDETDVSSAEETVSTETATQEVENQGDQVEQTEETTASTEVSEPQKPTGVQKRINELTRARYEAERRAQELEDRLKEQERQSTQSTYQSQKPRLEDYGYDQEAWATAMEDWAEQGVQQRQQALEEERQREAQMSKIRTIQNKVNQEAVRMTQKYPDYLAKINDQSVPNLGEISPAAQEALLDSDSMGEIAYYLANNPDEVYQFASLSPVQAVKQIAKLEAKLAGNTTPVTKAPPPIKPVETAEGGIKDPEKMSIDEWMDWRLTQLS